MRVTALAYASEAEALASRTLQQGEEQCAGRRDDVAASPPERDGDHRLRLGRHLRQHGLCHPGLAVPVVPARRDDSRAGAALESCQG